MKIQTTIFAVTMMLLFPMSAGAQGYNNLNINLNDVMVSQRLQDMTSRLDDANSRSLLTVKKHDKKHDKQMKHHKVALLKGEISVVDTVNSAATVGGGNTAGTYANQNSLSATQQ